MGNMEGPIAPQFDTSPALGADPCPFCGGAPEFVIERTSSDAKVYVYEGAGLGYEAVVSVQCTECYATGRPVQVDDATTCDVPPGIVIPPDRLTLARAAWNTRVIDGAA